MSQVSVGLMKGSTSMLCLGEIFSVTVCYRARYSDVIMYSVTKLSDSDDFSVHQYLELSFNGFYFQT